MSQNAARAMQANDVHALGITGANEIIAVCDTGLDRGDPNAPHPFIARERVKMLLAYGRKRADDPHGHGTHIVGCLVGASNAGGGIPLQGVAPASSVIVQSVFRTVREPFANRPVDVTRLLNDAYSRGARVHSNSWIQINSSAEYTTTAEMIDRFVVEHPDLVVITAVGNEGHFRNGNHPEPRTLRSPAVAKNAIAVGAVENAVDQPPAQWIYGNFFEGAHRDRLPPAFRTDSWANDARHWVPFSAVGPTADERIKPDVLAPGTAVLSTRSRKGWVEAMWGSCNHPDCAYLGGTSIAAPFVAGACALIREYLSRRGLAPSAALVKAVLLNGAAQDVVVLTSSAPAYPNPIAGFGRVQLGDALSDPWVHEDRLIAAGAVWRGRLTLQHETEIRVTLAWSDPPGRGLRSDLDLKVITAAGELLGNGTVDRLNNVEQVRTRAGGDVAIEVSAHRLMEGPQSFALALLGGNVDIIQEQV